MRKNLVIIFLLVSNIFTLYLYWDISNKYNALYTDINTSNNDIFEMSWFISDIDCEISETYYWINWISMEPLIADQSSVKVIENYYKCTPIVERGDIIIYETLATPGPIIKQVRALPQDSIYFDEWGRLYINWELLQNSVWDIYTFDETHINSINMYVINWYLQETSFLAFWDNVTNSDDSRRLGGLGLEYFKWKVILE